MSWIHSSIIEFIDVIREYYSSCVSKDMHHSKSRNHLRARIYLVKYSKSVNGYSRFLIEILFGDPFLFLSF